MAVDIKPNTEEDILLEATLGWLFQDVHSLMTRSFDRRLQDVGLTRSQWRVISPLLRQDGITQTTLAEIIAIEKAPLGRTLDRLEDTGWIRREQDPRDRRARRVYMTDKVAPVVSKVQDVVRGIFGDALRGFTAEEVEALMRHLMGIKTNIIAVEGDPHDHSK
jgi:DNA-binding MarR family transcriptional regulator